MIVGKEGFVHVPFKALEYLVKGSIINTFLHFFFKKNSSAKGLNKSIPTPIEQALQTY
jgi:hypothetical protein